MPAAKPTCNTNFDFANDFVFEVGHFPADVVAADVDVPEPAAAAGIELVTPVLLLTVLPVLAVVLFPHPTSTSAPNTTVNIKGLHPRTNTAPLPRSAAMLLHCASACGTEFMVVISEDVLQSER